ncbi:MAG: DUF2796 domain-containing protein [Azoarcus sp.]|jgi:hypothetical protein|nr:DUF2796 domain-containing protein [Azoarcus sp.]
MAFALASTVHAAPPHVHGEALLEITLEDKHLSMTLEAPLDTVLGFEHAPGTAEEKRKAAALAEQLRRPGELFAVDAAAQCVFAATGIESPVFAEHAEKHAEHAHAAAPHEDHDPAGDARHEHARQAEEAHHDLHAHFQLTCRKPEVLHGVDILLFKVFPRLVRLRVAFAGPGGQRAGEADARRPRFSW